MKTMLGVNNVESYIAGALTGLGIIQAPSYDVKDQVREGSLVEILSEYAAADIPISILYPHRKHLSERLNVFIE